MSEKENTPEIAPTLEERVSLLVSEFGVYAVRAALDRPKPPLTFADVVAMDVVENWKDPNFDHDSYRQISPPGHGLIDDPDEDLDLLGPSIPTRRE